MVFSSMPFLAWFLPVVWAGHTVLGDRARNVWLLLASLGFYAVGSDRFVIVLVVTSIVDYLVARAMGAEATESRRRALLVLSLSVNLGMLGWFKYANFAVAQLDRFRAELGVGALPWTTVLLPIGISFFTFQRISYVIDVHRGVHPPERRFLDFLLYVSLFPQLIAGPIVRYDEVRARLTSRRVSPSDVAEGGARFVVGLAKKVLVADVVAPVADAVFTVGSDPTTSEAWIGALAYTVQIYFDFSGYSDMAIGIGRMLGFTFPENFLRPYSAQSVTDFWRRWHVTLSSWFRDYLYVPLGGSRRAQARVLVNLAVVFLLTGLWHGAAWTFVVWGAYHGSWLIVERLAGLRSFDRVGRAAVVARGTTAVAVVVGWVFFRATSIGQATDLLAAMLVPRGLGIGPAVGDVLTRPTVATMCLALTVFLLPGTGPVGARVWERTPTMAWSRLAIVGLLLPLCVVAVSSSTFSPFLYFRF